MFSWLKDSLGFGGKKKFSILLVGLQDSGKTTLLYSLYFGELIQPVPTIQVNIETLTWDDASLTIWDVGGCKLPGYSGVSAAQYRGAIIEGADLIIFAIDSSVRNLTPEESAKSNVEENKSNVLDELGLWLNHDEFNGKSRPKVPFLFLANKQDLTDARSPSEIAEILGLRDLCQGRRWTIMGTSASPCASLHSLEGRLAEGFDWATSVLKEGPALEEFAHCTWENSDYVRVFTKPKWSDAVVLKRTGDYVDVKLLGEDWRHQKIEMLTHARISKTCNIQSMSRERKTLYLLYSTLDVFEGSKYIIRTITEFAVHLHTPIEPAEK